MQEEDNTGGDTPCFAHNLVGGHVVDAATWRDVNRFRKGERARLYKLRKTMAMSERSAQTQCVIDALERLFPDVEGRCLGVYWPIRGELDLRPWMVDLHTRGARVALPVVVQKGAPVQFHLWSPGSRMTRGDWNIPVPADVQVVTPDIVVSPLLGVDDTCYRLGNGGGYYDRTLAAADPQPLLVGVGQDFCQMPTTFPQPWDVPMDLVVLGDGTVRHRAGDTS